MTTVDLHLQIPEHLLRKIRAYRLLTGGKSADIEETLVGLLDDVVSSRCIELLGGTAAAADYAPAPVAPPRPRALRPAAPQDDDRLQDVTGISNGLGDEDVRPEGEEEEDVIPPTPEEEFIPRSGSGGGLTDDMVEGDTRVDDPDSEGAAAAPPAPKVPRGQARQPAEDAFASELRADGADGIRLKNKKNHPKRRGIVVPLDHMPAGVS